MSNNLCGIEPRWSTTLPSAPPPHASLWPRKRCARTFRMATACVDCARAERRTGDQRSPMQSDRAMHNPAMFLITGGTNEPADRLRGRTGQSAPIEQRSERHSGRGGRTSPGCARTRRRRREEALERRRSLRATENGVPRRSAILADARGRLTSHRGESSYLPSRCGSAPRDTTHLQETAAARQRRG